MLSRPQVGLCLKACGEQIDVLKDGVPQQPSARCAEQALAHRHGVARAHPPAPA